MLRGKILLFTFVGAICLLFSQCGLERAIEPWDAPTWDSTSGSIFKFKPGSNNYTSTDRLFLGYEIYYKMAQDYSYFSSDDISLTDSNQLVGHGFQRFYSSSDTWDPLNIADPPLLATDQNKMDPLDPSYTGPYTIVLNFGGIGQLPADTTEATASATDASSNPTDIFTSGGSLVSAINLRRAVHSRAPDTNSQEYGHFKRFNAFFATDTDVVPQSYLAGQQPPFANGDPVTVTLLIYVYAYGKSLSDQTFYQDIKSPLSSLLYNTITFYYSDEGNPTP